MSVTITFDCNTAEEARAQMLALLGGQALHVEWKNIGPLTGDRITTTDDRKMASADVIASEASARAEQTGAVTATFTPVTPGREHGKAGPGRQRRTKAEIEEDEKYPNGFPTGAQANISSGADDRVNPDDQEVGEEDADDEAAEGEDGIGDMPDEGSMPSEDEMKQRFTKDDLRGVVGNFGKLFKNDMLAVELAVTPAFEGAGVKNISGCPDDKIEQVYRGLQAIGRDLEANPEKIDEIVKKAAKLAEQG